MFTRPCRMVTALVGHILSSTVVRTLKQRYNISSFPFAGIYTKKHEAQKKKELRRSRRHRLEFGRGPKKSRPSAGPDQDYGFVDDDPESMDQLEAKKSEYLRNIQMSAVSRDALQKATERQLRTSLWMTERRKRLSASHHGAVCHMRPGTSCRKSVHRILYGTGFTADMKNGIDTEPEAKERLRQEHGLEV